ncbi:MAG: hypothetical protein M0Q95_17920 [Porticoccaceae bacterium]|nr:hypothetical protein [Porticoccaceae bacterium]
MSNPRKVEKILAILEDHFELSRQSVEESLIDLLADIHHLAAQEDIDLSAAICMAEIHFNSET